MEPKKGLDLAAGRLARVPGPEPNGRTRPPKKATSYGTGRLGITMDSEPVAAKVPSPSPSERPDPTPAPPARQRPRPEPRTAPAAQPSESSLARRIMKRAALLRRLAAAERLWQYARRPAVLAATLGVAAAVVVACFLWSGDDTDRPQTPSRAHGAPAVGPASAPAARGSAAPDRGGPSGTSRPVPPVSPPPRAADHRSRQGPQTPARPVSPDAHSGGMAAVDSLLARVQAAVKRAGEWGKAPVRTGIGSPGGRPKLDRQPTTAPQSQPAKPASEETAPVPRADAERRDTGEGARLVPAKAPANPPVVHYMACPPGFRFTGAICQPKATFANINSKFVKVGDTVGGAKVVKITKSYVEMELRGKRFVVGFGAPRRTARPVPADSDNQAENGEEAGGPGARTP